MPSFCLTTGILKAFSEQNDTGWKTGEKKIGTRDWRGLNERQKLHGVINARSRRDGGHMGHSAPAGLHFTPFCLLNIILCFHQSVERAKKKNLLMGGDLPGRRHRAAFPPDGPQLEPRHAKPSSSFSPPKKNNPQKPILRMQARLARTPRVRRVELVFTLLAPLMLHKELSQQLVATPAMPMFRSIVGQNAEHFLVIRWLRSLPVPEVE